MILIDLSLLKKKEEKEKGNFRPCLTLQSSLYQNFGRHYRLIAGMRLKFDVDE